MRPEQYRAYPEDTRYLSAPVRHPNFVTCGGCFALVDTTFTEQHAAIHQRTKESPRRRTLMSEGLENRYRVEKVNDPTGKHDDCRYFVLDPQHDPIARTALDRYAMTARAEGLTELADDLDEWARNSWDDA